ncbi:hypothetical protein Taro_018801 [Colocasia esculenta]|uniref:Aminotransferase-like plant mobile domain-containing protein n=1 Tax=Colocasia esculenta TaxID=4460 RepID=A0A843UXB5_COLES|nr:hypothetical protein [Colocasia esculenta]
MSTGSTCKVNVTRVAVATRQKAIGVERGLNLGPSAPFSSSLRALLSPLPSPATEAKVPLSLSSSPATSGLLPLAIATGGGGSSSLFPSLFSPLFLGGVAMEGEQGGGDGGGSGRRRLKKMTHYHQADEGPSIMVEEKAPAMPMGEDITAAAPGEDEAIGPKKVGLQDLKPCVWDGESVVHSCVGLLLEVKRLGNGFCPSSVTLSELRSRLGWAVVRAIYRGLPDFQRARLEEMGFGPFLRLDELMPDVALIQALKDRWDPECHAFLIPWGHMIPTLEDVAQITGLQVDGQAVTGELAERLLGLVVTRERSSLVARMRMQESLWVADACHQTREGPAEYMARLIANARAALAEEEGAAADRDLRCFRILVIGKLILGTRGDPVSCRCLPLLEDLSSIGSYAWGAALLAHLFDSLGTSSRETGVAGFFPLLHVWSYYHLPSLGHDVPRRPGAVPLLQRWLFRRDEQSLCLQVTLIHDALDMVPFGHWTPYVGEDDAAQPWVERCRAYFGRDIWLHAFNTVVPLHHRLVARTLGLHQAVVEFPTRQRPWERLGRGFRGIQQETDWTVRVREQLTNWEQRGREVASEATSDEDYFRAYARRYGAQVYKGSQRPREELDRAQQMVGGASSSREDPGRSVLEGQLAAAVAQAEDALAQVQEREAELRESLARMIALEAEMAELHLRPEVAEVSRWCQETEEATRWRTEAGDLRTQLGEERHCYELLRSEMKGLERALALVGRSRSSVSRSGILSGSAGHYLTGSSGRRRNEEEARRRERAPEGSETGPRVMAPPYPRPPEGTGESG